MAPVPKSLNPPTTLAEIVAMYDEAAAFTDAAAILAEMNMADARSYFPKLRPMAQALHDIASSGAFDQATADVQDALRTRCRALDVAGKPWADDWSTVMTPIIRARERFMVASWGGFVASQA